MVDEMAHEAGISVLYIPCGSEEEARSIASTLLAERLIACANIYRSRSLYSWEGEVRDEIEHVLIVKTTPSRVQGARRRVLGLHSYEVPCLITIEHAAASPAYERWVYGEVSASAPSGNGGRAAAQRSEEAQG